MNESHLKSLNQSNPTLNAAEKLYNALIQWDVLASHYNHCILNLSVYQYRLNK